MLQDKKRNHGNLSFQMRNCAKEQKLLQDKIRVSPQGRYDALDKYI